MPCWYILNWTLNQWVKSLIFIRGITDMYKLTFDNKLCFMACIMASRKLRGSSWLVCPITGRTDRTLLNCKHTTVQNVCFFSTFFNLPVQEPISVPCSPLAEFLFRLHVLPRWKYRSTLCVSRLLTGSARKRAGTVGWIRYVSFSKVLKQNSFQKE